jgi:hypothetical protein
MNQRLLAIVSDYFLSEKFKPENGGSQSKLSATLTIHLIVHQAPRILK